MGTPPLSRAIKFFTPARAVPKTTWCAPTYWTVQPKTFLILISGLFMMGIGGSLSVQSNLGNPPWTVLAQGISLQAGISLGWAFFIVSCFVLLIWFPLKVTPGFGTIANTVFFAASLQLGVTIISPQNNFELSLLMVVCGISMVGFGTALYISCGLGSGPRDGWMIGLLDRTGVRIWKIRFVIECFALLGGYLLGGKVGLGTVLVMLFVGQAIAISFTLLDKLSTSLNRNPIE
ncbi:MAG: hypothetical protein Q8K48_07580 [Candidatus Planktophila sp.]|nr:hypothetical protein [Candidatus Planktophila sp.]